MQSCFGSGSFVGEASSLPLVRFRDSDMYSFPVQAASASVLQHPITLRVSLHFDHNMSF